MFSFSVSDRQSSNVYVGLAVAFVRGQEDDDDDVQ